MLDTVEKMTVLELSELVKALEDKFGVTAALPMVAGAAAAGGGASGGEGAAAEEKTSFTVQLVSIGDKKIQVIKEVREITGLGLKEAKALVDGAPKAVKEDVTEEEANKIKEKLTAAGAGVELK
ncbi:MAG: 50S ribosomal protein L7/L12 [Candidatus Ratteibacteria bacterium]|nr:50S ribosomal protein L7/L12 [Candidatus Ratteibacteria bacterium]